MGGLWEEADTLTESGVRCAWHHLLHSLVLCGEGTSTQLTATADRQPKSSKNSRMLVLTAFFLEQGQQTKSMNHSLLPPFILFASSDVMSFYIKAPYHFFPVPSANSSYSKNNYVFNNRTSVKNTRIYLKIMM